MFDGLEAGAVTSVIRAGTVVTEMNTPDRPPAFAEVRESAPAAAAMSATMKDHLSGV
jgi:hypothetical protein